MDKELEVKCPHCKKEFNYYSSDFKPFCCERCRQIDLGHWLSESYVVPGRQTIVVDENDEQERD